MVKIERSFPAPSSLAIEAKKISGVCTKPDVIERLRSDFHDKCYICEMNGLQDPQVEHLLPHENGKYPDRKYDWNNLFWACGHCNSVKNQAKYYGKIMDCCVRNPEKDIMFLLEDGQVKVKPLLNEDTVVMTAALVSEVFCADNTSLRDYKSDMRLQKLNQEMNILYDSLEELRAYPQSQAIVKKLQALLRKESAFAAFKRFYVRMKLGQYPQLADYIA